MSKRKICTTGIHHGKKNWITLNDIFQTLQQQIGFEQVGGIFTFSLDVIV